MQILKKNPEPAGKIRQKTDTSYLTSNDFRQLHLAATAALAALVTISDDW